MHTTSLLYVGPKAKWPLFDDVLDFTLLFDLLSFREILNLCGLSQALFSSLAWHDDDSQWIRRMRMKDERKGEEGR